MPRDHEPRLQDALRAEGRRLTRQTYPGDLADDVLPSTMPGRWLRPALAGFALLALAGLVSALVLLQDRPTDSGAIAEQQLQPDIATPERAAEDAMPSVPIPALPPDPPATAAAANATSPAAQQNTFNMPALPVTAPLDRGLLPLRQANADQLLDRPSVKHPTRGRPARTADHPLRSKPDRLALNTPTKRSIDRLLQRAGSPRSLPRNNSPSTPPTERTPS